MWVRKLLGIPPFLSHSPCAPKYEPDKWNDCPNPTPLIGACSHQNHKQGKNNCYNYACNIQNDTFAQLGNAGGYTLTDFTPDEYAKAVETDGLIKIARDKPCPQCCYKVALIIRPISAGVNPDFHWYRQDDNGRWSHKLGKTKATDKDGSGNPIDNPENADSGGYTAFCGYFCVCKNKVNIA